ncbi:MAG: hemerythrin domain-containing protein [Bacteroidetes bacterium]|nr:hemerythrin domain-containing protein [Bacteroidota bacterium]
MTKSMKVLFDEHEIIINSIDTVRQANSLIGKDNEAYEKLIHQLIGFFRNYADKYHHFKEEEILFPEMAKRNELLADGVIKEMFENHSDFREMIKNIEISLNAKKYLDAQLQLEKYTEALLDHIAVENDEVFQTAESIFSEDELEKIYFRFEDCDRDLGNAKKEELKELSDTLRKNLLMAD